MVEWRCPSATTSGENPSLRILRRIPYHMSLRAKAVFRGVIGEKGGYWRERGFVIDQRSYF
jgi:hypothetical protein